MKSPAGPTRSLTPRYTCNVRTTSTASTSIVSIIRNFSGLPDRARKITSTVLRSVFLSLALPDKKSKKLCLKWVHVVPSGVGRKFKVEGLDLSSELNDKIRFGLSMPLLSVVCCCKSMQVYFIHNSFRKHGSIICRRGAVGLWHLNHISHFACLPLKSQYTGNCVSRKVNAKFALK